MLNTSVCFVLLGTSSGNGIGVFIFWLVPGWQIVEKQVYYKMFVCRVLFSFSSPEPSDELHGYFSGHIHQNGRGVFSHGVTIFASPAMLGHFHFLALVARVDRNVLQSLWAMLANGAFTSLD